MAKSATPVTPLAARRAQATRPLPPRPSLAEEVARPEFNIRAMTKAEATRILAERGRRQPSDA